MPSSPISACSPYLGWRNPMANVAALCDALLSCWLTNYSSQDDYQACLDSANDTINTCITACAPGDDGSAASAARTACDDACDGSFDDCSTECQATFDSCVAVCDPPGPGTDCFTACITAKLDCDARCSDTQKDCRSTCYLDYQIAIAGIAPSDANCTAACCSSKDDHIVVCKAPCADDYNSVYTAANVAYWGCVSGCSLEFWDGGSVFIYDSTCTGACEVTRQSALGTAQNERNLCEFDCQNAYDNRWGSCSGNYRCSRHCTQVNQDAVLLCTLANLAGSDQSTYAHCMNDAAKAQVRCNLDCCFNLKGRNAFDIAAIECVTDKMDCLTDIVDTCPAPGTGSGDPCEHSGSDECIAAIAAQAACVASATDACNASFKDCIQAIDDPNLAACGGCLGDFLFPSA